MKNKIKIVFGYKKQIFNLKVIITVFVHFFRKFISEKIPIKNFIFFLRRLLYFLYKMQHNKFVEVNGFTKIGLYIPGFKNKAFYTACKKFLVFNEKLPCTTVLISITSACTYKCNHCYQKFDKGSDLDIDKLVEVLKKMQKNGIAFFNIEGGEPFLVFDRLRTICENIDLRSEIWINSTGNGITYKKLKVLKQYNVTAIMLSMHHHLPDKFNKFMGNENAWKNFVNAIKLCNEVGIPVALNVCLLKHSFYNTDFQQIMEFAKLNNICYVQLIKPKPSGGWLKSGVEKWYKKDLHYIKNVVNRYNGLNKYKLYPPVSAQIIEEDKTCFGCTAGGTDRFYLNAKGDLQPCEFLNISYGNVMKDNFEKIYSKMRKDFFEPNQNWICEISSSQISNICLENNLSKLPLSPDLSKKITEKFKNDNKTEFYKKL